MYNYKHIPSSLSLGKIKSSIPKEEYTALFQETLDNQFYNASNWWTIEEETLIGSRLFSNVDVRIAHVINAETGLKLGDDWKTLLFKDVSHPAEIGKYYIFEGNTWITTNIEFTKNLTGTCTIRRCNNTLRWIDERTGAYHQEPCAIEYLVKEPRDYATQGSPFPTPGGFLQITTQVNDRTNRIVENQRFLFGNQNHWIAYRVLGAGINAYRNTETYNNSSANVLTVDMIANFINTELDDVVNGIADVYTNVYSISLSLQSIEGGIGDEIEIIPTLLYNGKTASRDIQWESTNTEVATVVAGLSNSTGIVSLAGLGQCNIIATLKGTETTSLCTVDVIEDPSLNYQILVSPVKNYVLEEREEIYQVYLYENNIQTLSAFNVTCNGNSVPSANYNFEQINGNSFRIKNNLRDLQSYLTITCTSGVNVKTLDIYLRGAWLQGHI